MNTTDLFEKFAFIGCILCTFLSMPLFLHAQDRDYEEVSAAPLVYHLPQSRTDCLKCHDDYLFSNQFPESIHGLNSCTSCHSDITDEEKHMLGEEKPSLISCGTCHKEIAQEYTNNYHYLHQNVRCYD